MSAFALAALSLTGAFTGWVPSFLAEDSPVDFLYLGGEGSAVQYFVFMGSALVGTLGASVIHWGFTGKARPTFLNG